MYMKMLRVCLFPYIWKTTTLIYTSEKALSQSNQWWQSLKTDPANLNPLPSVLECSLKEFEVKSIQFI